MSVTTTTKPRLLIIGSGWAGFYIAEHISLAHYSVTLISPRRTSAFTPLLASAAVGLFNFYLAEEPVRSKHRKSLKFIKANVLSVDFPGQSVHCSPAFDDDEDLCRQEFDVEYDLLVLAPGCMPNTFGTPGVDEHGIFIKNVSDAMKVRKNLFDLLEKASLPSVSEQRARDLLHIAIVGGGPTGIELTAELDDLCHEELADLYPGVAKFVTISIYDVAPHILSAYDAKLHEYATAQLLKRKVNVAPNTMIEKVERDAIYIKGKGRVPCGMLIWATGNKNVPLVEKLDVRMPEKGLKRIVTDGYCRVFKKGQSNEIYDGVFAIGDAADIEGASLPTTAEVAVQKAKYLVANLNSLALSSTSTSPSTPQKSLSNFSTPFKYTQKQLVSYIGQHDGIIAGNGPDGEGWTGRSAWLAWRSGSIMWNRNWRSRVAIAVTWVMNAIWGKEVAKM